MPDALTLPAPFEGLSPGEAARRLREHGPNRLVEVERWALLKELLHTVADPMALMLAAAAAIYLALGERRDGIILLVALVPVLGIDVLLETRSRKALKKLSAAVAPRARVVRGGRELEVPTEDLVPGDLLVLFEGDVLHADGVVREGNNLALDESPLTGESEPQQKTPLQGEAPEPPPGARFYAGSLVLAGSGHGEVTRTGAATEFGKIAGLMASSRPQATPLQKRTSHLVRRLFVVASGVAVAVFAQALWRGEGVLAALLAAVSLAIAAMPEEFPLVYTLFLSLGAWRLSKRGVLVRRLSAVETLGSTTVICTDKTGTLTAGTFALDAHVVLREGLGEEALLEAAFLACEPDPRDTMERALVVHCKEHGLDPAKLHLRYRLVKDYDFDPAGKHMSHVWERTGEGGAERFRFVAKGALEGVLEHCRCSAPEREAAEEANAGLAARGMRVLAVAERSGAAVAGRRDEDERDLSLIGLLGFRDPLRADVPAAVEQCRQAGIKLKLITGDHVLTAHAIAEAAGIPHTDESIVGGDELDRLLPEAFAQRVRQGTIFARIRPEQKHAIVEALERAGETVAMTGDGINDAPALRRADIGVSLGVRGTAVARAAADLVLLDDSFAALTATVFEGRHIYTNIQKSFLYLIAFHVPIVGLALVVPLLGLPLLLLPVHLVWLELIVHPVSALVFEGEPPLPDLMRRPPRDPKAPLVSTPLALRALVSGLLLTAGAAWMYWSHLPAGEVYARSGGVAVVICGSLLFVFSERMLDARFGEVPFPRTLRFWGVWGAVALSLPVFMVVPPIAGALQVGPLGAFDWLIAALLALATVVWRPLVPVRRPN
ncbi:MAG: cation-translocating P-type ATPase [Myxococcaceae bacterium]